MITTNRWGRFELVNPASNTFKYWEARETDRGFEVAHGRIGAVPIFGGILTEKQIRAKVAEKLRKGYLQVAGPIC
jgi:hypothetical protein